MNSSLISAAQGIGVLQTKVDQIANNIANVNTVGYKAKDTTFGEILYHQLTNQPGGETAAQKGRLTPEYIRRGNGVLVSATPTLFTQGNRVNTEVPTDLMIEGRGFFRVQKEGEEGFRYTRNGSFKISPTGDGTYNLRTATGEYLLDRNDERLEFDVENSFSIGYDGTILEIDPDGNEVYSIHDRIGLYDFQNPQVLRSVGDGMWVYDPENDPNFDPNFVNDPINLMGGGLNNYTESFKLVQGALEQSNVDLSKEMTDLITTQRTLQMVSRSLQMSDQMMGMANDLIRR